MSWAALQFMFSINVKVNRSCLNQILTCLVLSLLDAEVRSLKDFNEKCDFDISVVYSDCCLLFFKFAGTTPGAIEAVGLWLHDRQ